MNQCKSSSISEVQYICKVNGSRHSTALLGIGWKSCPIKEETEVRFYFNTDIVFLHARPSNGNSVCPSVHHDPVPIQDQVR